MNVKIISTSRVLELSTTVDTRFILKHENKRRELNIEISAPMQKLLYYNDIINDIKSDITEILIDDINIITTSEGAYSVETYIAEARQMTYGKSDTDSLPSLRVYVNFTKDGE
jgi:hypothetical protein